LKFKIKAISLYKKTFTAGFFLALIGAVSNLATNFRLFVYISSVCNISKKIKYFIWSPIWIILFKEPEMRKRLIGATIAVAGVLLIAFA